MEEIRLTSQREQEAQELIAQWCSRGVVSEAERQAAFTKLYNLYYQQVSVWLYKYEDNTEEVKELVQDVFMKVYSGLDNFAGNSQFTTWLYTITENVAKNWIKHETAARQPKYANIYDYDNAAHGYYSAPDYEDPASVYDAEETARRIVHAFGSLPKKTQEVYEAYLNTPSHTVQSREEALDALNNRYVVTAHAVPIARLLDIGYTVNETRTFLIKTSLSGNTSLYERAKLLNDERLPSVDKPLHPDLGVHNGLCIGPAAFYSYEPDYRSVCEITGLSYNAVKQHMYRAHNKLKEVV